MLDPTACPLAALKLLQPRFQHLPSRKCLKLIEILVADLTISSNRFETSSSGAGRDHSSPARLLHATKSSGASHGRATPVQSFSRIPMSPSKSRIASDEGPLLSTAEMFIQLHSLSEHLPGIQAVARLAPTAQLIDELTNLGIDDKLATGLARAIRLDQDE